jgi:hypothetical protein
MLIFQVLKLKEFSIVGVWKSIIIENRNATPSKESLNKLTEKVFKCV